MSPIGIASTLFSLFQSVKGSSTSTEQSTSRSNSASNSSDFSSSLALRMATLQAQSANALTGAAANGTNAASGLDFLINSKLGLQSGATGIPGLSVSGRNMSLFDPESAYKMMTNINNKDITYKAQFSEMSDMKSAVASLEQAGKALGGINQSFDSEAIKTQLQAFAGKYNEWINRFDSTVKGGGVLAGTQAAEISLYELEQSVESIFNGAKDGLRGLRDLGFTIDQNTNLASIDTNKLDAVLAANKTGVVNAINEFSANFAKSAELLNSAGNFIPNRLSNLDRVIDYIHDNKPSLQAEFGLGDPAKPSAQINKALASYNQIFRI